MNKEILISRINELCKSRNITRTAAFKASNVGKNFISNLNKSNASEGKLTMLANYFDVSVEYLKGETDEKEPPEKTHATIPPIFSNEEVSIIYAYRAQPELQTAVKRVLGLDDGTMYMAAETKKKHKYTKNKIEKKDIELSDKMYNAPKDESDIM